MTVAILLVTVTFPLVARALAAGDLDAARDRVEKDLGQGAALVLIGTAFLMACAPSVVALLFQRGAFGPRDAAATAAVIRVYSFGLPAQALIGVMIRPYFSLRPVVRRAGDPCDDGGRRLLDWYPAAAMVLGLVVTTAVGLAAADRFGALGLAAGNAAGITTTAVLLLRGLVLRGSRCGCGSSSAATPDCWPRPPERAASAPSRPGSPPTPALDPARGPHRGAGLRRPRHRPRCPRGARTGPRRRPGPEPASRCR
ncbi:lipid II flippase MurJ [Kitasatospora aburaviensis]